MVASKQAAPSPTGAIHCANDFYPSLILSGRVGVEVGAARCSKPCGAQAAELHLARGNSEASSPGERGPCVGHRGVVLLGRGSGLRSHDDTRPSGAVRNPRIHLLVGKRTQIA